MKSLEEKYMLEALKEAKKASDIDEVPIGCVIVKDNKIISRGHNLRESKKDVTCHAEIVAIRKANKKLNDWWLKDCDLYVTIEPCLMCMGAIYQSHLRRVFYGAKDIKGGAHTSIIEFDEIKNLNHYPEIISGVLEEECQTIIKDYFKAKRKK